jgi:hypothetical protein
MPSTEIGRNSFSLRRFRRIAPGQVAMAEFEIGSRAIAQEGVMRAGNVFSRLVATPTTFLVIAAMGSARALSGRIVDAETGLGIGWGHGSGARISERQGKAVALTRTRARSISFGTQRQSVERASFSS